MLPVVAALAACSQSPSGNASSAGEGTSADAAASQPPMDATGVPQFRTGLWEVTDYESDGTTAKRLRCIGQEVEEDLRTMFGTASTPECVKTRSSGPQGLTVKGLCRQPGGTETEAEVTLSGSAIDFDMKLGLYSIVNGKRHGDLSQSKGRWMGECPAGMKPGDESEAG
ncbi:DUF3617 family protein [Sphingomonas cavernae]|uniref:DUF3617 family protein n=2 Tax=Sphingomonas cavernae TaxID=2320861 RepID=A0A418WL21_9SPHN|nr:DUF3617 family protein [Sphingomonas cavernae]